MRFSKHIMEVAKWHHENGPQNIRIGSVTALNRRIIHVKALSILPTYSFSDLEFGVPTEEINQAALDLISKFTNSFRGHDLPVFTAPIEKVTIELSASAKTIRLPLFFVSLELESDSCDDEHVFSSIKFVQFLDNVNFEALPEQIGGWLKDFEWVKYAKNWNP